LVQRSTEELTARHPSDDPSSRLRHSDGSNEVHYYSDSLSTRALLLDDERDGPSFEPSKE
ncbi:hypothetical protein HAX54_029384, partial [Datura stramonium]|nr:hypothetical protein [Datura stramonium]